MTSANIYISFQPILSNPDDFETIQLQLKEKYMEVLNVSKNESAKVHISHMAGGRSVVPNERVFRFNFPESPGALQRFLSSLDMDWNVSLFHYRNHGHDVGRVLVGIQVGRNCARLQTFLDNLGYSYVEETDNPAYLKFLRNTHDEETKQ